MHTSKHSVRVPDRAAPENYVNKYGKTKQKPLKLANQVILSVKSIYSLAKSHYMSKFISKSVKNVGKYFKLPPFMINSEGFFAYVQFIMPFGCQELASVALSIDYLHTINEIFSHLGAMRVVFCEVVLDSVFVCSGFLWCEYCIHID